MTPHYRPPTIPKVSRLLIIAILGWMTGALLSRGIFYPVHAQDPNYIGYVDARTCGSAIGWAADRNRLNQPLQVSLYADGVVVQTVTASISRGDVGAYLKDDGRHAYILGIPVDLQDGRPHNYQVRFEQSTATLSGGTFTQTCGTIPITSSVFRAGPGIMLIADPAGQYTKIDLDATTVPLWGSLNQNIPCWQGELAPDPAGLGIYVCKAPPRDWKRIRWE